MKLLVEKVNGMELELNLKAEACVVLTEKLRTAEEECVGLKSELEAVNLRLEDSDGASDIRGLNLRLLKSEDARSAYVVLIAKKDEVIENFKEEISIKDEELKKSQQQLERFSALETKLDQIIHERDRLLRSNIQLQGAMSPVFGRIAAPKRASGSAKVKCFMFAFTGRQIRRDAMEKEFQYVNVGKFNENLKYCVVNLFKAQSVDSLMDLVVQYNRHVGYDWAINLVAVNNDLPPILSKPQYPTNPILAMRDDDSAALPADYHSWVNEPPPKIRASRV